MKDLYKILGIARDATADQVKAAYRTLARKFHPDVNKSEDAAKKFTEIQQAYEVLSSDEKRKRYDRTGSVDNAADPFASGFGRSGYRGQGAEADDIGEMFNAFFRGRNQSPQQPPRNLNITAPISLDLETIAKGGVINTRTPAGETVAVNIPPAVAAGATLRVKGKGNTDSTGRRGDLLLQVRVKPHPIVSRGTPGKPDDASLDLTIKANISIADATLGGEISIDRLGQTIRLTIPEATPSGRALRLKGKGLTNAAGNAGNLFIELAIVPPDPTTLSQEHKQSLRDMCKQPHENQNAKTNQTSQSSDA